MRARSTLVDILTVSLETDADIFETSVALAFECSDKVATISEGVALVHSGTALVQVHTECLSIAAEAFLTLLNSSKMRFSTLLKMGSKLTEFRRCIKFLNSLSLQR